MIQQSSPVTTHTTPGRMLAAILGEGVTVEFEPSSTLSRAHQAERAADRMVAAHDFSGALEKYRKAQDLMEQVINLSENACAKESLQRQLANLRNQPKVIQRKKEDFARRQRQKSLERRKKLDHEKAQVTKMTEKETLENQKESIMASKEAKNETDSLLACLNENIVHEADGFSYKMPVLKQFFAQRSNSIDLTIEKKSNVDDRSEKSEAEDPQRALIKKLERQNEELMEHIRCLFQTLHHCEEENKQLKVRLGLQEQELETYRSQSLRQRGNAELAFPFEDDYFGGSPFSDPPSLPPLPHPLFLVSDDEDVEAKDVFEIAED